MPEQIDLFSALQLPHEAGGAAVPGFEWLEAARCLPAGLRLGTSSWAYSGWTGVVYRRQATEQLLARAGLASYAQHPLLGAVGLDKTYYAPFSSADYRRLAKDLPANFRFLVKAHAALTTPADAQPGASPDRFLDIDYAIERVITPTVEGLQGRLGVILFQFPPLSVKHVRDSGRFASAIGQFLDGLPRGPQYAVEVRNRELLTPQYADALARNGVTHSFNIHPRMPDVLEQAEILGERAWLGGTVAIRWMLHPTQEYEAARRRYFPFDRLVDPDLRSRFSMAELIVKILSRGNEVLVIANNKAEGSAPYSLLGLAQELARHGEFAESGE